MTPGAVLRHALADSDRRTAAARVLDVLERASPPVRFAASHVLFCLGSYDRALAEVRAACADPRLAQRALLTELEWSLRLGRVREARSVAARSDQLAPHPRIHASFAEVLANQGCYRRALAETDRALELAPDAASLLVFRARLRTLVGLRQGALEDLRRATELRAEPATLLEASRLAAEASDFEAATAYATRVQEPAADVFRARIALFRGDTSAARRESQAPFVLGAAAVLEGNAEAALVHLNEALMTDPDDPEAHTFRAEALYHLGRPTEALEAANRAVGLARGPLFAAHALQNLSRIALADFHGGWAAIGEVAPAIEAFCPDVRIPSILNDIPATKRVLEQLLRALHGNRTTAPSHLVGDKLVAPLLGVGPRYAARHALQRIVGDDDEEVLGALDDAVERYPYSQLPRAHRGEAHLWLGDYRSARADLEAIIRTAPRTRWPYIGMTCLENLEGNPEAALSICALGIQRMGSEGPAVYVNRGEANRLLGRHSEAEADLARARTLHPRRVSSTINLALLHLARSAKGPHPLVDELRVSAAGLIVDAESETSARIEDEPVAVLEQALLMMRGNRSSSCITYYARGVLRSVVLGGGEKERERDVQRAAELAERLR